MEGFAHEQVHRIIGLEDGYCRRAGAVRQPPPRDEGIELTSRSGTVHQVTPELEPDVSDKP